MRGCWKGLTDLLGGKEWDDWLGEVSCHPRILPTFNFISSTLRQTWFGDRNTCYTTLTTTLVVGNNTARMIVMGGLISRDTDSSTNTRFENTILNISTSSFICNGLNSDLKNLMRTAIKIQQNPLAMQTHLLVLTYNFQIFTRNIYLQHK